MRRVPVIAIAAVALALLTSATYAGCAVGKAEAISPEATQLLASRPNPPGWIVDGLGMTPAGTGSIRPATQPENTVHACWFDFDLPRCEQP